MAASNLFSGKWATENTSQAGESRTCVSASDEMRMVSSSSVLLRFLFYQNLELKAQWAVLLPCLKTRSQFEYFLNMPSLTPILRWRGGIGACRHHSFHVIACTLPYGFMASAVVGLNHRWGASSQLRAREGIRACSRCLPTALAIFRKVSYVRRRNVCLWSFKWSF